MAFGTLDDSDDVMNEINMTPLVDVMLVLLIVFIITVPALNHAVRIDLPRASSQPDPMKPQTLRLSVDAAGQYWWNDQRVSDEDLIPRLRAEAGRDPQPELHIRGDKAVRYERVAEALAAAQQAGLSRIGFLTEPKAPILTKKSFAKRRDAGTGDLRVFRRLDPAHADGAQAMPLEQDGYAAFQHAVQRRGAQEGEAPVVDHLLVQAALAAAQRCGLRLGRRDLRRDGRRAVEPLQPQEVAAVVDDGNADSPAVFQGFGFRRGGNGLHVGQVQGGFVLHGGANYGKTTSIPAAAQGGLTGA